MASSSSSSALRKTRRGASFPYEFEVEGGIATGIPPGIRAIRVALFYGAKKLATSDTVSKQLNRRHHCRALLSEAKPLAAVSCQSRQLSLMSMCFGRRLPQAVHLADTNFVW